MEKSVLISIRPKWVELIALGKKTYELRKTYPHIDTPFKCYIYMSQYSWAFDLLRKYGMDDLADRLLEETGTVVGEFMCVKIDTASIPTAEDFICNMSIIERSCLTKDEVLEYGGGKTVYALRISQPVFYDKPRFLSEFQSRKDNGRWITWKKFERPPQSWCYIEEERK